VGLGLVGLVLGLELGLGLRCGLGGNVREGNVQGNVRLWTDRESDKTGMADSCHNVERHIGGATPKFLGGPNL